MFLVNYGKCGKCLTRRALIKTRPLLPPISSALSFLSFSSAAIRFRIGNCMSRGGVPTLDALAAAIRSFTADFDDLLSRTSPLTVVVVLVRGVAMVVKCIKERNACNK
jgi:hypothetical protein